MKLDMEDLAALAEIADLVNALKDSEEIEKILLAIQASGAKLAPMIEMISEFQTKKDLKAIRTMMDSGLSADQSVALMCARYGGQGLLGNIAAKGHSKK